MDTRSGVPIACTLEPGSYQRRLAWIAELARDGLRGASREDLRLDLSYASEVASRVREMVRLEQECCAFLTFELTETAEYVRLSIVAPERARDVADALFEQFLPSGMSPNRTNARANVRARSGAGPNDNEPTGT
jgi:hypothetical protein